MKSRNLPYRIVGALMALAGIPFVWRGGQWALTPLKVGQMRIAGVFLLGIGLLLFWRAYRRIVSDVQICPKCKVRIISHGLAELEAQQKQHRKDRP
jgi:uncharacterized protein YjeT (DUF2065 family)